MSTGLIKFLGIVVVVLLLVELIGSMVISKAEEEDINPIDSKGMIKEGYSVDHKLQEEMELNSYPTLSNNEYNQNLLYSIGQCLFTAKELETYECIGNNVEDSFFNDTTIHGKSKEKGKYLFSLLTKGNTITSFDYRPIHLKEDIEVYRISISILESKSTYNFILEISNKKIQNISEENI
ncbi:hypothetical protein [Psychrobacillus sp. FSL H8-0487]|uniref:hypothetical protein n=1 Tax=Psychrobacillus sp. FSL H8-0487 TaxID=2921391 RepID=UPI0030F9FC77